MELEQSLLSEIDLWIAAHREELVGDILDAVRIRSVSEAATPGHPYGDGCAAMLDHMCALSERYGFSARNYEYHCASGLLQGTAHMGEIGIWSHMDVVPEGSGWTYAPYAPVIQDGYLIGRGVNDNKGPAMAALYAMRFLKESGRTLRHDVKLFFGSSEEAGMADIDYYGQHYPFSQFSLVPDAWFPVCAAEKGILRFTARCPVETGKVLYFQSGTADNIVPNRACAVLKELSCEAEAAWSAEGGVEIHREKEGVRIISSGVSKHAARPEGSCNAALVLAQGMLRHADLSASFRRALEALVSTASDFYGAGLGCSCEDALCGKLTHVLGIAKLEGHALHLDYNVRYPAAANRSSLRAAIRKTLEQKGFSLVSMEDNPPSSIKPDDPVIPMICDTVGQVLHIKAEPYTMGGGTYTRKLPYAAACGPHRFDAPSTLFPNGRGDAHQPDECVSIQLLLDALKIYILLLMQLDEMLQ